MFVSSSPHTMLGICTALIQYVEYDGCKNKWIIELQWMNHQVFLRLMTEPGVLKSCDIYQDINSDCPTTALLVVYFKNKYILYW